MMNKEAASDSININEDCPLPYIVQRIETVEEIARLRQRLAEVGRQLAEARAVIDKLPKTADGVCITEVKELWYLNSVTNEAKLWSSDFIWSGGGGVRSNVADGIWHPAAAFYSSQQAAERAANKPEGE